MRQLLTIIVGFFCTASAYADCESTGLWVFPRGHTIKQNSIFVLEGYAESQNIILGLNKKHSIYLRSGNKKIKLFVTEICVGQFYLTQAVLKPEIELEAGLEYTMYIDSLSKDENFNRYNDTTHKYESVTYTVLAEKDIIKPQLSTKPKEIKKLLVHYGCGPSIYVVFNNPAKDNSEIIIKTTLKNLKTGKETTFYIEPNDGKIQVGHDMCSGAFNFDDSNNYEAEFLFMDASGNFASCTGDKIKFTKPTKDTNLFYK